MCQQFGSEHRNFLLKIPFPAETIPTVQTKGWLQMTSVLKSCSKERGLALSSAPQICRWNDESVKRAHTRTTNSLHQNWLLSQCRVVFLDDVEQLQTVWPYRIQHNGKQTIIISKGHGKWRAAYICCWLTARGGNATRTAGIRFANMAGRGWQPVIRLKVFFFSFLRAIHRH